MPMIEENEGRLHLEFLGTAMVIDTKKPSDGIRQLVRMLKVLELRVVGMEIGRANGNNEPNRVKGVASSS